MNLLNKFQEYIKTENLFQQRDRLFVAVSGGVDSIVLCELCNRAGYQFSIAHANFQLRGKESDEDEAFVSQLAKKYGVRLFTKKFFTGEYVITHKAGIQEAARNLRYEWFGELMANDMQRSVLLTAHHANDNIETLLMNFFKGTGIAGLQGIPVFSKKRKIARPLLFAKKNDILEFAKENNLNYREDSSNATDKYSRNFIRHELLPVLEKIYPEVTDNLLNNLSRFKDIQTLYQQSVESIKQKLFIKEKNEIHIPVLKMSKAPALATIAFEIIKEYGFTPGQVKDLLQLLKSDSGKYIQSSTHRILRNRKWLIISPLNANTTSHYLIETDSTTISFPAGLLKAERVNVPATISRNVANAELDASQIKFPLLIRKWKQGDYFYPLGMKHKKKLSRFFIDQKLSMNEKEEIWLVEMHKKILWIINQRIDDRFKVTPKTKEVLRLSFLMESSPK